VIKMADINKPATADQKKYITEISIELGYDPDDYLKDGLTVKEASKIIAELYQEL
jgi:hypothetical protein